MDGDPLGDPEGEGEEVIEGLLEEDELGVDKVDRLGVVTEEPVKVG